MTRPDYVAMSDPTPNPQFRRHWEHPPPQRRKRPAAANQGRFRITGNSNDDGAQSIPSGPFVKPFDGSAATAAAFGGRPAARPMVSSDWRVVPRNTLQGFFTLRPASGLVLHGCTLHQQGASPCVGLPGAPQLDADGRQRIDLTGTKLYAPVVEIADKGAYERFRTEETLSDTVRAKLETQTAVQANEEAQEDPVTIFVEAVPALLVAARAHLTDKDGDRPCIADNTRWVRQPQTYNGLADFLEQTARLYRRALWVNAECQIEIWCEKDALAGVIAQGTMRYDVPLMVSRGFSSDTYLQSAAAAIETDGRPAFIYQFGDHEPSGVWIARSIEEGLRRHARPRFISGALLSLRTKSASATSRPAQPNERAIPTPAVSTVLASNSTLFRRNGCEPWCASVSNGMSTRISSPHCSNLADRFFEVVVALVREAHPEIFDEVPLGDAP